MLRKNVDRRAKFIENMHLYDTSNKFNGPMHGLMSYADELGITFESVEKEIMFTTPLGHKIDLCTDHDSHFKHALIETCRYAAVLQLKERVHDSAEEVACIGGKNKRHRADMQGISPYIDVNATTAMVNHKTKDKYEKLQGRPGLELLEPENGDPR